MGQCVRQVCASLPFYSSDMVSVNICDPANGVDDDVVRSRTIHNSNLFKERCMPSEREWDPRTWTLPGRVDAHNAALLLDHINKNAHLKRYPNQKTGWMWTVRANECNPPVDSDFCMFGYDQYGNTSSSKVHAARKHPSLIALPYRFTWSLSYPSHMDPRLHFHFTPFA